MAIYTLTPAQLKGGGIYNSFEIPAGGGVVPFSSINSFEVDGTDDYIDGTSAIDTIKTNTQGTISAWVKISSGGSTIFNISDVSTTRRYIMLHITGTQKLYGQLRNNGGNTSGWIIQTDDALSLDTWYHVAVVQNAVSPILYVNGVEVAQTLVVGDQDHRWINGLGFVSANNLNIGRLKTSDLNQNYFDGLIDEVSYFSSALSSTDIETIYNGGVPNNLNDLSTLPTIWYRMGEEATFDGIRDWTLRDQGTGRNDGTSQNMAEDAKSTDVPPNLWTNTKSILLDGVDDYVDCGNPASLQITNTMTLSIWVKTTDTSTYEIIIGKDSISTGTRSFLLYRNGSIARFLIFKSSGNELVEGTTTINDGNWHHIMGVNDGTDLKIYVNGTLEGTNVGGGGTILNGISTFNIGRRASAPANRGYFTGNIDEVAVWDTDQSANASAIGGTIPTDLSTYNPISWWRGGDGDTAPTLTDNGSGGNDGTMNNFTTFSTDVPT